MRFLQAICAASSLLAVASAKTKTQSTTDIVDERSQAVPTITMKPDEHRIHKRWEGPSPTGSKILIHPTGVETIPKHGFDIRFGPALAKSLHTALHVYCEHHNEAKCVDRLVEILDRHNELKHRKRQLGAAEYLAAPLVGAAIYYFGSHDKPTGIHLPSEPVAQISAHPKAKDVVFITDAHDDHPLTYDGPPTKTASAHVSVKTEHSNQGNHHKGDVIIHVPEAAAHFLHKMLSNTNMCSAKRQHRRVADVGDLQDADVINDAVKQMLSRGDGAIPIDQMILGKHQPMISLPLTHLNVSKPNAHVKSLMVWIEYNHIRQLMKLKTKMRRFVIQLMYVAAYESCVKNKVKLDQMVIPNHKADDKCPDDSPKDKEAPLCVHCHGWERGICEKGAWKGCPCLFIAKSTEYHETEHIWNMRETILHNLLDVDHDRPEVSCDEQSIDAESTSFGEAFKDLCQNPLTAGGNGKKIVKDGLEFTLKHEWHKDKCPRPKWDHDQYEKQCLKTFREFKDHTKCVYDSHVMAKDGHYHSHCATSTFHIQKAKHHHHHHHPREGPLHCHAASGCFNEVNSADHVAYVARGWCYRLRNGLIKGRHMKPNDKQVNLDLRTLVGTNFFARWIDGCKLESSHDIAGPNCEAMYYETFAGCNNGERGGWHREGCVAMGMHPVCS